MKGKQGMVKSTSEWRPWGSTFSNGAQRGAPNVFRHWSPSASSAAGAGTGWCPQARRCAYQGTGLLYYLPQASMCQPRNWLGPFRDGVQWSSRCTSSALWTKSLWSLGFLEMDRSLARAWQHGSMAKTVIAKQNAMRCNGRNHDSMHRLSVARTNWQLPFDGTSQFFRSMALVWARPYRQASWTCTRES